VLFGLLAVLVTVIVVLLGGSNVAGASAGGVEDPEPVEIVEIVVFHGEGCPYCARALDHLAELAAREPRVRVVDHEVWNDPTYRGLFAEMAAAHGIEISGVPTIFLGDAVWVGFDATVAAQIDETVTALLAGSEQPELERTTVDVPLVGTVDVADRSLVAATILIAFVDGVNPCSFWVLSMLLALVLHSRSRARILVVGAVFLTVTSALYGLYMLGAYSVLDLASGADGIRWAVALVAGVFGLLHVKEYVTHRGPSVTIPEERKPGMLARMRGLAATDRSWPALVGGTAVLAVGVSLVETPCTAGLPLLWTNLLTGRGVEPAGAALLFAVYLLVFLFDELVVFTVAVTTMRAVKLQERHGRVLQLVSGTLMLTLAVAMVAAPRLLESVTGTLVVFGSAAAVVVAVLAVDRLRPRARRASPRRGSRPAHSR
jgi:glutaredoxin